MELVIDNKIIDPNIELILETLRKEICGTRLKHIKRKGDNVVVTCPYHKNGQESHPSCQVYALTDNPDIEYGTVHCFTCGRTTSLITLVAECFQQDESFAREWLVARFGNTFIQYDDFLPKIEINKPIKNTYLDESILQKYNYYHPYMQQRKLTKEVIDRFHIGYDREKDAITFPVWDEHNRLVMITERSVHTKQFYIPDNVEKPVYLLNDIINRGVTKVYVTESQINALTLRTWGMDSIALFGTGSKHQYDILNRSGIRNYILCFDGDEAGDKGAQRFIKNIKDDAFVSIKKIPRKKDINDLTYIDFCNLNVV